MKLYLFFSKRFDLLRKKIEASSFFAKTSLNRRFLRKTVNLTGTPDFYVCRLKTVKSIIAESGIPYVVKHVVKHVVEHKNKTGVRENHKKGQNCTDCNSRNCKAASFF